MSVRVLRNISGRCAAPRTLRRANYNNKIKSPLNTIQKRFKEGWHFDPVGPDATFIERWAVRDGKLNCVFC